MKYPSPVPSPNPNYNTKPLDHEQLRQAMHTIVHRANVLHVPYQSTHAQYKVHMHSTMYTCAVQSTHVQYKVHMCSTT